MKNKIIGVMGNIASGKTTLSKCLGRVLDANIFIEDVTLCPYLDGFYSDRTTMAFQTKMWFLDYRFGVYLSALQRPGFQIVDGTPWDDLAHADVSLIGKDHVLYMSWFGKISSLIRCDTLIYLSASIPSLLGRVAARDRVSEQHMGKSELTDFLTQLQNSYLHVLNNLPVKNVIRLDTDQIDFTLPSANIDSVVKAIHAYE